MITNAKAVGKNITIRNINGFLNILNDN